MFSYALVSGRIEAYEADSVRYVPSEYNPNTILVRFKDISGHDCVGDKNNFRTGSLEELQEIVNAEKASLDNDIRMALNRFPHADCIEKMLIKCLIKDGYTADEINKDMIGYILLGMKPYFKWNASFEDAYFDYMH